MQNPFSDVSWGFDSKASKKAPKPKPEPHEARYASRMFTLLVGPEEVELVVHESHLAKSRVLERMCNSNFLEASQGTIKMPEDDPESMGCVIRYLYKDDFEIISRSSGEQEDFSDVGVSARAIMEDSQPVEEENIYNAETKTYTSDPVALELLSGVYIHAEKYEIDKLLVLCLEKMVPLINLTTDPQSFLKIAAMIYRKTPDSDKVFRPYFRDYCGAMLIGFGENKKEGYRMVDEYISEEGDLAIDIFRAYRGLYQIQQVLEPDSRAYWVDPSVTVDPAKMGEIIDGHLEILKKKAQRLEFEHAIWHPRCRSHIDDKPAKHFLDCGQDAHGRPIENDLYPVYSLGTDEKLSRWQKFRKYTRALRIFRRS